MTACPDKSHLIHAFLDGELDAANTEAFETHLKTCAGCAAELAELQALRARIAGPGVAAPAPEALRGRIEAMIAAEAAPAPRRRALSVPAVLPWGLSGAFAARSRMYSRCLTSRLAGNMSVIFNTFSSDLRMPSITVGTLASRWRLLQRLV